MTLSGVCGLGSLQCKLCSSLEFIVVVHETAFVVQCYRDRGFCLHDSLWPMVTTSISLICTDVYWLPCSKAFFSVITFSESGTWQWERARKRSSKRWPQATGQISCVWTTWPTSHILMTTHWDGHLDAVVKRLYLLPSGLITLAHFLCWLKWWGLLLPLAKSLCVCGRKSPVTYRQYIVSRYKTCLHLHRILALYRCAPYKASSLTLILRRMLFNCCTGCGIWLAGNASRC